MQSRFRDWADVRVFLAVMREGSTLAASRHLGMNQSTVGRRIDALEHALGLVLFDRTTRGAEPTEAAGALLPLAEAMEYAALTFDAAAQAERTRTDAPIRITVFENEAFGNIGAVVAAFIEENPRVKIEFVFTERNLDLMKGEADVALRMTPRITDDRLIARKVGQTNWTYYASRSYAEKHDLPPEFSEDMEAHTVHLLRHFASSRRNVVFCSSVNDLVMAIQTGQGIGPFPLPLGDANPNLVRCFDPPPGSDLPVWLITNPVSHKRADVRRFTAFAAPRIAANLKKIAIAKG